MLQVTTVVVFVTSARFPRLILIVSALPTYDYLTILQENDVMVGFDSDFLWRVFPSFNGACGTSRKVSVRWGFSLQYQAS